MKLEGRWWRVRFVRSKEEASKYVGEIVLECNGYYLVIRKPQQGKKGHRQVILRLTHEEWKAINEVAIRHGKKAGEFLEEFISKVDFKDIPIIRENQRVARTKFLGIALPRDLMYKIDAYTLKQKVSRSEFLRSVIRYVVDRFSASS